MPAHQPKISLWLQCQHHQQDTTTTTTTASSPKAKRACYRRSDAKPYDLIVLNDDEEDKPELTISVRSGVDGFPSLVNRHTHLLLRLCDWKTEFERESCSEILVLLCEKIPNQAHQLQFNNLKDQIRVVLRDNWVHEIPPLRIGYLLRLIEPTKTGENSYELASPHLEIDESHNNNNINDGGLLIFEPHTLISSTALAQSLYCPRKALFQDRFRSSGSTLAMTVGTIAHELFQIALFKRPAELSAQLLFRLYRQHFLQGICLELIAMQCSLERFEEELQLYLDNIVRWIKTHVPQTSDSKNGIISSKPLAEMKQQYDGPSIPFFYRQTHDIEENVWTPTIGVKGRIDVSFMGSYQQVPSPVIDNINSKKHNVYPLELKTGKTYGVAGSIEHQSQVMLYTLMLSERANGGRIEPGFLLYMRDNSVAQVLPNAIKLRGLIHMRNRLAVNFSRFTLDSFPDPLINSRSCQYCPYSNLCGALALANNVRPKPDGLIGAIDVTENKENNNGANKNVDDFLINDYCCQSTSQSFTTKSPDQLSSDMRDFLLKSTEHLSQLETRYALHWIAKCLHEWGQAWERGSTLRLFQHSPEEREKQGGCIANLHLHTASRYNYGQDKEQPSFLLHFSRNKRFNGIQQKSFVQGGVVTVSMNHTYALLLGTIQSMDDLSVVLLTDKELPTFSNDCRHHYRQQKIYYHLDKHDGFTTHALALGNIVALLENTPNSKRIRTIFTIGCITENEINENDDRNVLSDKQDVGKVFHNKIVHHQEDIVKKTARGILNTPDYALVRAKGNVVTPLLVWLVRCLLRSDKSVLFCANNNATIDELLLQFKKCVPTKQLLRIGNLKSINSDELTELLIENKLNVNSLDQLESDDAAKAMFARAQNLVLEQKPLLVASTLHSVPSHAFFACFQRRFDFCLLLLNNIDSTNQPATTTLSSKFSLPDSLLCAPLLRSDRFALFSTEENSIKTSNSCCINDIPLMERLELFLNDFAKKERRRRMFNLLDQGNNDSEI